MQDYETNEDYLLDIDTLRLQAYEDGKLELADSYNALIEELERVELALDEELAYDL